MTSRAARSALPRVVSVGPDRHGQGGMATVERQIAEHAGAFARVVPVSTHVDGSARRRAAAWATGSAAVLVRLVTRRVDVLHLHVAKRGSVLRKGLLTHAAALLRVPVVLHCHGGVFADDYRRMPAPLQRAVSATFRRASRVIVLGEHWRSVYVDLVGVPDERVSVVRNAVDVPAAVPVRPHTPLRCVYLGKMDPAKGAFDLVEAVVALPVEVRGRLRVVMGGHGDVDAVRKLVAERGVADVVDVVGWLDPPRRDAALAAASVFVLPSHHEGLPMALLEAMAWGLVPVVTPVGAIPEVVVDGANGLFVPVGDVDRLAEALRHLADDADLVTRLAAGARATAEAHGLDAFVAQLARVWRAAVEGSGG